MKARITECAARALGLPTVARDASRARRLWRGLLARSRSEWRRGNVGAALALAGLYLMGW